MSSILNVENPDLHLSDEDVAGIFAVSEYLALRDKVSDEVDQILIDAIEGTEQEINLSDLTESIISLMESRFPLKPRGLKEIVLG